MNEPRAMREIHEIREKMSLEKRGLTIEERVARANASVDELKKRGIKVADPSSLQRNLV